MSQTHKRRSGIDRLVHAGINSWHGLHAAIRHESAFRQELVLGVLLLPAAWWLGASWPERVLLGGSVLLVLVVELLNSGIEAVVDRVSLEMHELSKRAKDYGSAAVMLSLMLCGWIWAEALWARWAG